jgi:hypothetical protein
MEREACSSVWVSYECDDVTGNEPGWAAGKGVAPGGWGEMPSFVMK